MLTSLHNLLIQTNLKMRLHLRTVVATATVATLATNRRLCLNIVIVHKEYREVMFMSLPLAFLHAETLV